MNVHFILFESKMVQSLGFQRPVANQGRFARATGRRQCSLMLGLSQLQKGEDIFDCLRPLPLDYGITES